MKVFVASSKGQGRRNNDFFYADEGELLMFGFECDRDKNDIDGVCGCRRALFGCDTFKGTTTFTVVDKEFTLAEFIIKIIQSNARAGRSNPASAIMMADELMKKAKKFKIGTILEKRGNIMQERKNAN